MAKKLKPCNMNMCQPQLGCKAGLPLPDFTECDGIGVDERNLMRFMFAQIPSHFSFPLPDRAHTIFAMFLP